MGAFFLVGPIVPALLVVVVLMTRHGEGMWSLGRFTATTHMTGNQLIRVEGESAWCEFYTLATHRIAADENGPERDYVASVRYVDRMECRSGEWRIARRQCILDWARSDPVPEYCDGPKTGGARRDRSDPSYGR